MPVPDRIGYADLYEVAPTSAIDRSLVRPLNEWMEFLESPATIEVPADGSGESHTLGEWMAILDTFAQGATYVDKSGTITLGGSAQVLIDANPNRRGFWVQNQSNDDLWINSLGDASAVQPSLWMPPGAHYDPAPSAAPLTAISIYGATTGQAFSAREW